MLTSIFARIGTFVLEYVWKKLVDFLKKIFRRNQIDKESKESVQPLKDATDGKKVDDATDSALDRF